VVIKKIQGERLEIAEVDQKSQMADKEHIQRHCSEYFKVAAESHKADLVAESANINNKSKSKHQITHLMVEAIRNKERYEHFWASSKEGSQRSKAKYGWGFGFVN